MSRGICKRYAALQEGGPVEADLRPQKDIVSRLRRAGELAPPPNTSISLTEKQEEQITIDQTLSDLIHEPSHPNASFVVLLRGTELAECSSGP